MLNALRHQWFGRGFFALTIAGFFACSTPCGISGLAGSRAWGKGSQESVLNALRHQWFGRGRAKCDPCPISGGAQRLAASVVWQGPRWWMAFASPRLCSTPCGISGLAGLEAVEKGVENAVLNALRHQWFGRQSQLNKLAESGSCSTPCGISGLAGPKGR